MPEQPAAVRGPTVDPTVDPTFEATGEPAAGPAVEAARSDAAPSPRLRRQVLARDGHRCVACASLRSLMLHHVVFRSAGGPTSLDNLVTLCARCHGLVHDGFLRVVRDANTALRLLDREGRPLHGRLPAPDAITLAACAVAHTVPEPARAGRLRSEADIPTVVDGAW